MKRGKIESIIPKKDEVEINQVLNNIRNTCPFCEKRFDNAKKVENYVICIENRINAINCKRTCHTVWALKEHKMIHRSDYFFECNICHVKYKSEDSLKKHDMQNSIAITNIYVNIVAVATNWRQTWLITWRDYFSELQICRFCRKEVKNVKIHEWRHQKRDKEMKYVHMCHSCHKKFLYRDWTIYEKDFRCEGCGKEYHGTRESMNHKRFKKPSEDFDLILCQKAFSSCSNFYQHPHWDQAMFARKILFSLLRHRRHHLRSLSPLQYDSSGDCWIGQELFAETIKIASWTWDYDRFEITFFANWDLECDFK